MQSCKSGKSLHLRFSGKFPGKSRILILSLICAIFFENGILHAQNVDCAGAITICKDPQPSGNPSGMGINDYEPPGNNPGCLQSESTNSSWYYFEFDSSMPPGSVIGFIINPLGGSGEDYDWALFGPDVGCAGLGNPIRCSSSSEFCGFCPQTGMGMGATDFSEGPGTGDGFVSTLVVQPGQGFYLNINNWKGTGNGFTLDFTGDAADFLDCGADPPCSLVATTTPKMITKCQGDPDFSLNANAVGGVMPYTYSWSGTGSGTSFLDDPDSQNPNGTIPDDFFGNITYTVTVSDGNCESTDMVELVVNPKPVVTIEQAPVLCSNGPAYTLQGNPQNGTWGGVASNGGIVKPSDLPAGIYQATLEFTNSFGCKGSASIDIEIIDPIEIIIDPIPPQCINNPAFQIFPDPPGGQWSGNIDPDGEFNPAKFGVGSHTAIYSFTSPEGCKSEAAVIIDVLPLPDIQLTDPGILCANETIVPLTADPGGGIWSGVADQTGNVYPNQKGAGSYTAYYSYTDANGCSNNDSLLIIIVNPPTAQLEDAFTVCNSNQSGDNTLVDFSSLILSGDNSGYWTDSGNSGAGGNFPVLDFNGVTPGTYTFTYTTQSAQGSCKEFSGTVEIIVIDCSCPSTAILSPGIFCSDNANIDLNLYKLTNEAGTWKIDSFPAGSNPATITGTTFQGTAKDPGKYIITFTLSNPVGGNCPEKASTSVTLVDPPAASLPASINVCNQTGSGSYPVVIDLYSYITAGDKSGSWTDISNSGASGNFNNLNFSGIPVGEYLFQYTTNSAITPCNEQQYTVKIIVSDCNCPTLNLTQATQLCQDNGTLNLLSLQGNSEPGTWSVTSTPPGSNPATIQGADFIVKNSDAGTYTLQYTLNNPVNGCPASAEIQIVVVALPAASVTGSAKICNSTGTGSFVTTIDFNSLVTGGDKNGTWTDTDNSGATGIFPSLDFTNVIPGNYTFTYITNSAISPCPEVSYSVTVIVQNCECPDVSLIPEMSLCNDIQDFDLSALKLTTEAGTWSVISSPSGSPPLGISGNTASIQGAAAGSYSLQFSLNTAPPAGCPASGSTTLNIIQSVNAGSPLPELNICRGTNQSITLADRLNGADPGGNWILTPTSAQPGNAFNSAAGTLDCTSLDAGLYSFQYLLNAVAPCQDNSSVVSVKVNELPVADAGTDKTIDCTATSVSLTAVINPASNISVIWSGPGITNPSLVSPQVDKAGTYTLLITDNITGCSATDEVEVLVSGSPITDIEYHLTNTSCPGVDNGSIQIDSIYGGTPEYTIALNGQSFGNTSLINGLKAGAYSLMMTDAQNCSFNFDFNISQGNAITVDLGPDLHVLAGDNYNIGFTASVADKLIENIIWTPSVCDGCKTFTASALQDIVYVVQIQDLNGCSATDDVRVFVKQVRKVYIPNVFSPDADGINDVFVIYSDSGVKNIKSLRIYNRWGGLLFENENFPPNDPKFGWNGKFNGKKLDNGVYVFVTEIEFTDGETGIYKGDITISH